MYLKNRIIFFFITLFRFVFYLFPSIFFISVYFVLFSLISFCFRWFRFILFSFRWFRFVSFRFCWFRFASFRFVSFSLISFRFVSFLFRFALYRYPFYLALPVDRWMWWIFSTPLIGINEAMVIIVLCTPYIPWCFTKWPSIIYTEAFRYASHSLETIFTTIFKVYVLYNSYLEIYVTNTNSNEYKLTAIVLDSARHRFFKHVGIKKDEIDKLSFLKLSFANNGLDTINLGNILHHKSDKSTIPPCFKDQSVHIISYTYIRPIATNIFNYKNRVSGSQYRRFQIYLSCLHLCKFSIHT